MVDEDFKKFEKYVFASSNGTTCVPTTVDKSVPVEEGTSSSPTMAKPATADNTARYKYKNLAFVLGPNHHYFPRQYHCTCDEAKQ